VNHIRQKEKVPDGVNLSTYQNITNHLLYDLDCHPGNYNRSI